jgi:hypothetical protein
MFKDKEMNVMRSAYSGAKQRCTNPKDKKWNHYGGRGIKFLFNSINHLISEIGLRPKGKYTLDRIDNDGNYEPGNVRWATQYTQVHNRKRKVSSIDTARYEVLADYARAVMGI